MKPAGYPDGAELDRLANNLLRSDNSHCESVWFSVKRWLGFFPPGVLYMADTLPMTIRGKALLDAELKKLMLEERPEVIRAIEEARAHGDISENAEYDAAKERQGMIEGRISDIQGKLAGAEIVNPAEIKSDRVVFGATVTVRDEETDETTTYQIVGVDEADVKKGMISILSPIARALIGKKKGDVVTVQSPKGDKDYEVVSFEFK
jgi:transcription elongation factor GreA